MLISDHFVGDDPTPFDRLLEKRLSAFYVTLFAQQHVYDLSRFVHGTVQVGSLHTDPHVCLVYKPAPAERVGMASPNFCQEYAELLDLVRHRLSGHVKTALSRQIADVGRRQAVAEIPAHGHDNLGTGPTVIREGCTAAVGETEPTCRAAVTLFPGSVSSIFAGFGIRAVRASWHPQP